MASLSDTGVYSRKCEVVSFGLTGFVYYWHFFAFLSNDHALGVLIECCEFSILLFKTSDMTLCSMESMTIPSGL